MPTINRFSITNRIWSIPAFIETFEHNLWSTNSFSQLSAVAESIRPGDRRYSIDDEELALSWANNFICDL